MYLNLNFVPMGFETYNPLWVDKLSLKYLNFVPMGFET